MNRLIALLFCVAPLALAHAQVSSYGLAVDVVAEHDSGPLAGMTTYQIFMECVHTDDVVSSVSGDAIFPANLSTTTSFYQDALGGATPNSINPLLFGFFTELPYDSWVTIGISQTPNGAANEGEVSSVESPTQAWLLPFESGNNLVMDDATGGAWFVTQNYSNGVAGDDHRVLLAQVTTDGEISGTLLVQVFEHGVGESDLRFHLSFEGTSGSGASGVPTRPPTTTMTARPPTTVPVNTAGVPMRRLATMMLPPTTTTAVAPMRPTSRTATAIA